MLSLTISDCDIVWNFRENFDCRPGLRTPARTKILWERALFKELNVAKISGPTLKLN